MKNNKGFVMTETLVVTVFLVTIFTFIYVSIVPLVGKYEDIITREADIDIVYKLYHIRKLVYSDGNRATITNLGNSTYKKITCSNISSANREYCNKMMQFLDLDSYTLIFVNDIFDALAGIRSVSQEMYNYIKKYEIVQGKQLILLDNNRHTIAHLAYSD